MKKSLAFLLTTVFLLFFFQTAQGGIIDYSTLGTTDIIQVDNNGGTFYDLPWSGSFTSSNISGLNPSDERTFTGGGASMTLKAAASGGGGSTPNTFEVSAFAATEYVGEDGVANRFLPNSNGVNMDQGVTASIQRRFENTGSSSISSQVTGSLSGTPFIQFNDFNDGQFLADYTLSVEISVSEFNTSVTGVENIYALTLTEDNLTDFLQFEIQPSSEGYYYQLLSKIRITTEFFTFNFFSQQFTGLEGPLNVGTEANPLVLTATIGDPDFGGMPAPVPVPPSLFLLISGVAGISFMRYRRDQTA